MVSDFLIARDPISFQELKAGVDTYRAGNIQHFVSAWKALTSDKFILDIIMHGLRINLHEEPVPVSPHEYPKTPMDQVIIMGEIQ